MDIWDEACETWGFLLCLGDYCRKIPIPLIGPKFMLLTPPATKSEADRHRTLSQSLHLARRRTRVFSSSGGLPPRCYFFPHAEFTCNCCSVYATKGGGVMGTPIYGVLMLDPSPHWPLQLVKRRGANSVIRERIPLCDPGGTSGVNPRENSPTACRAPSHCVRGRRFVHTRT